MPAADIEGTNLTCVLRGVLGALHLLKYDKFFIPDNLQPTSCPDVGLRVGAN